SASKAIATTRAGPFATMTPATKCRPEKQAKAAVGKKPKPGPPSRTGLGAFQAHPLLVDIFLLFEAINQRLDGRLLLVVSRRSLRGLRLFQRGSKVAGGRRQARLGQHAIEAVRESLDHGLENIKRFIAFLLSLQLAAVEVELLRIRR